MRDVIDAMPPLHPPRHLRMFGDLSLLDVHGRRVGEPRRKPLALLAMLVSAGADGVDRAKLAEMLWPDLDDVHARKTLAQTIYALRRELGADDAIVGTQRLSVVAGRLTSDLARVRDALERGDNAEARRAYAGPFLDGTYFRGCSAFEKWVEAERDRWELLMSTVGDEQEGAAPATLAVELVQRRVPEPLRRTARVGLVVLIAAALVFAAGLAVLPKERATADAAQPIITEWQERASLRAEARRAHLASIDSSRLGRVLFLTPTNVSRNPALDSLISQLEWQLYALNESSFAQAVDKETAQRLQLESQNNRLPTTLNLEIAKMMRAAGAGIAIRSNLQAHGDTVFVELTAYRDLSRTELAKPGASNLEVDSFGGWLTSDTRPRKALEKGSRDVWEYVRSLESCDADKHRTYKTAPWCWRTPKDLQLVPGTSEDRSRDWSREMMKLRGM